MGMGLVSAVDGQGGDTTPTSVAIGCQGHGVLHGVPHSIPYSVLVARNLVGYRGPSDLFDSPDRLCCADNTHQFPWTRILLALGPTGLVSGWARYLVLPFMNRPPTNGAPIIHHGC
uniref:Uncharacterized protein n=1 Tax=Eutreptiella gymnastica TaxID=73025 RepID=A0A7S1IES5_9EUGL